MTGFLTMEAGINFSGCPPRVNKILIWLNKFILCDIFISLKAKYMVWLISTIATCLKKKQWFLKFKIKWSLVGVVKMWLAQCTQLKLRRKTENKHMRSFGRNARQQRRDPQFGSIIHVIEFMLFMFIIHVINEVLLFMLTKRSTVGYLD